MPVKRLSQVRQRKNALGALQYAYSTVRLGSDGLRERTVIDRMTHMFATPFTAAARGASCEAAAHGAFSRCTCGLRAVMATCTCQPAAHP